MAETLIEHTDDSLEGNISIADLFLMASRELALSDSRIYHSVDKHLQCTRRILSNAEAHLDLRLLGDSNIDLLQGPPSYDRQTRKSLESLCRKYQVRGYSRMTKVQMITHLKEMGVPDPPTPLDALSKSELLTLLKEIIQHVPGS